MELTNKAKHDFQLQQHFEYKGKFYKLVNFAFHKDRYTREWREVAIYTDGHKMYTRDIEDFHNKFKPVPKEQTKNIQFDRRTTCGNCNHQFGYLFEQIVFDTKRMLKKTICPKCSKFTII